MTPVADDPRVRRGLEAMLAARRARLDAGESPVGWKVGVNVPEVQRKLGLDGSIVGFLTSGTQLEPGASWSARGATRPALEPEIAIHVGDRVDPGASVEEAREAIVALAPAIEIADLDRPLEELEAVLAGNIFHRAVVLGAPDVSRAGGALDGIAGMLERDGTVERDLDPAEALGDLGEIVRHVAAVLDSVGQRLRVGDVIISGSIGPPLALEDFGRVRVDLGAIGAVEAQVTA